MFSIVALSLAASLPAAADCADVNEPQGYHLSEVCTSLLEGAPAYSATWMASLTPGPASQQVMVYRAGEEWFLRIAGFRWDGDTVVTRRRDVAIAEADAARVREAMAADTMTSIAELPYYGEADVICMDGASLELASAIDGQRLSVRQHSCAGETRTNQIAAILREIAIRYDPDSATMLDGLALRQD